MFSKLIKILLNYLVEPIKGPNLFDHKISIMSFSVLYRDPLVSCNTKRGILKAVF